MIYDDIKNSSIYFGISSNLDFALNHLDLESFNANPSGEYLIDGKKIHATIMEYQTRPIGECKFEAHKRFIDIHIVLIGNEKIGYANCLTLKIADPYDKVKDVMTLEGDGDFFGMDTNKFAIFFPQDAHMPGIKINNPQNIKKLVIKVAV